METKSHGWGGRRRRARAARRAAEAACEAACGDARRRRRAKRYGAGLGPIMMPCGSATTQRSIAAAEKGQAAWPGIGARRSATRSAGGRGGTCRGRRARRRDDSDERPEGPGWRRGETDTGRAEHTRGMRPCPNVRQQRRVPGKEVGNRREPSAPVAGSVGPIVGLCVLERHRATWNLAGNTAILQGVGEMVAGSEQCKEPDDEKYLRVDCRQ
jgi:hypothetical protein